MKKMTCCYSILVFLTHGFEESNAISTNVARWSKTEATNETSAQIRENVTVQVWHDQNVVLGWVLDNLNFD